MLNQILLILLTPIAANAAAYLKPRFIILIKYYIRRYKIMIILSIILFYFVFVVLFFFIFNGIVVNFVEACLKSDENIVLYVAY